ncbi:MAG: homocysteine S-methyltransferase family protein, partial [Alphaproteobacteria bacterium]
MSGYGDLDKRLAKGEVIILDGAVGTQLQKMGVPMSNTAWAATALHTHPFTVRRMHEEYVKAGCDVITVNTYSAAPFNLIPLGLGDVVRELNLRAVMLAMDARDRWAKDRPVYIAGSVSNYGLRMGIEKSPTGHGYYAERIETSEDQAKAHLRQQADILAEAGVDLMLAESTGGTTHRRWVLEACLATGLPVWGGFKVHLDEGSTVPKVG